jgi:hypothetical protein
MLIIKFIFLNILNLYVYLVILYIKKMYIINMFKKQNKYILMFIINSILEICIYIYLDFDEFF